MTGLIERTWNQTMDAIDGIFSEKFFKRGAVRVDLRLQTQQTPLLLPVVCQVVMEIYYYDHGQSKR